MGEILNWEALLLLSTGFDDLMRNSHRLLKFLSHVFLKLQSEMGGMQSFTHYRKTHIAGTKLLSESLVVPLQGLSLRMGLKHKCQIRPILI